VALNQEGHPIKMRMTVVDGFKTKSVADWVKRHIASGSAVISDGLACFKAVKEANCEHLGVVTGGNLDWLDHPAFNWVNTMIGNVAYSHAWRSLNNIHADHVITSMPITQ
jgi:hypothetical protein